MLPRRVSWSANLQQAPPQSALRRFRNDAPVSAPASYQAPSNQRINQVRRLRPTLVSRNRRVSNIQMPRREVSLSSSQYDQGRTRPLSLASRPRNLQPPNPALHGSGRYSASALHSARPRTGASVFTVNNDLPDVAQVDGGRFIRWLVEELDSKSLECVLSLCAPLKRILLVHLYNAYAGYNPTILSQLSRYRN